MFVCMYAHSIMYSSYFSLIQILFCICKQFHFSLNLFLGTKRTTYFCILSTNSFIFLSIYFWGTQGPQILFCICKQFQFSLNLFLGTKRTKDSIFISANSFIVSQFIFGDQKDHSFCYSLYKQFHFSLNLFLGTTMTTDSILYLQTVSFFSQFYFFDHGDHRLYFVSINSFTFLCKQFHLFIWGTKRTTDSVFYLQTVSFFSQFIFGTKGPQIQFCICKQFHSFLNLFLGTTRTTDYVLYLQTLSLFSQFIFGDHNDYRFYFVSTNSFTFLSIYFWWPQGPQILFCIRKQFHSFLNLFLRTTRTTDYVLYLQTLSLFSQFIFGGPQKYSIYYNSFIFLSIYFWGPKGPQIQFCIKQFHSFLNLFFDGDHKDHRLYFVSINTFIFLCKQFHSFSQFIFAGTREPQILFYICKQFHFSLNLF